MWDNISDTDDGRGVIAQFGDIALRQDAMVVVIAFMPEDAEIGMPPWTAQFDENVANDSGQLAPDQLFPGIDVSDDGDVTSDGEEIGEDDVGPEVDGDTSDN